MIAKTGGIVNSIHYSPKCIIAKLDIIREKHGKIPSEAKSIVFKVLPWGVGAKELIYIGHPE